MAEKMDYKNYEVVKTEDGSFTLFSSQYNQCYHSTKDGALVESMYKHILPAFSHQKDQNTLTILDICFGLGFNTLATLWYNDQHDKKTLKIYTPELDSDMLKHLDVMIYPTELKPYIPILQELLETGSYRDNNYEIELYIGDARSYIKKFTDHFDIVYQDAFSPDENPFLWTREYFKDIKSAMKKSGVLTTYSIALKTRLALYDNGFDIYTYDNEKTRTSTLALLEENSYESESVKLVNMKHKILINSEVQALSDKDI